ncbi:748_t:CDS:2, partial [Gigaspora margarita]
LTNLDYKPGYKEYTFYKYWLASNGYTSSFDRNNTALLNAYQPEEIYSQYIVQIKEKFALVNHLSEVYKILDTHEYIDIKEEFQPIDDENALNKGANLVIEKYRWLQIGKIEKRFINFQAQSIKECPICDVKYKKNQLYRFIRKNISDKAKLKVKPKLGLNKRIAKAVLNSCLLPELSEEVINVKEMEDFPKTYPNFLSKEPSTTLIHFPIMIGKTKDLRKYLNYLAKNKADLSCIIWISYRKTLSNESIEDIIIVQVESLSCIEFSAHLIVAILDEINAIQHQMNSGSNAQKSENAMHNVLRSAQHVLAIDRFANESKTIEYLYDPNSGAEAMRIGFEYLKQGKRIAFVVTSSNMARALVKEASKLSFKAHAYYGDMDGK